MMPKAKKEETHEDLVLRRHTIPAQSGRPGMTVMARDAAHAAELYNERFGATKGAEKDTQGEST